MRVTMMTSAQGKALEKLATGKIPKLKVGFFEGIAYEGGTPVAQVAAVHEFGAAKAGIPPRPFFRPTVENRQGEWKNIARELFKQALANGTDPKQALESLGLVVEGDVKRTISTLTSPALKQSTINARASKYAKAPAPSASLAKPLVATSLLLNSVTSKVEG